MLLDLTHSLQIRPTRAHVLWELANCISSGKLRVSNYQVYLKFKNLLFTAVGADGFRLYLAETGDPDILSLYIGSDIGEPKLEKVKSGLTVPTYVARTREAIRLSRGDVDARFPEGLSKKVYTILLSVRVTLLS